MHHKKMETFTSIQSFREHGIGTINISYFNPVTHEIPKKLFGKKYNEHALTN